MGKHAHKKQGSRKGDNNDPLLFEEKVKGTPRVSPVKVTCRNRNQIKQKIRKEWATR